MPSIVTHHLFAESVYHQLPKNLQKKIEPAYDIYQIFAQSFDNLFYYKFLTPWQGKKIRELGNIAQQTKTDSYFENILNYITENHLENNQEILAYLYGSINHYVLDYNCHPYVFYYTGDPKINKKYRGLHEKLEVNIDAYMLAKLKHKVLAQEKMANILLPKKSFSKELMQTLDYTFWKTFYFKNMGYIFEKSVQTGNFLLNYFVTDKTGMKKMLYAIKDFLTPLSTRRYKYLSFHVTNIIEEYTNEKKETWYNPWNKNESTLSFYELYTKSTNISVEIITIIESYFNHKTSKEDVMKIIGNYSYTTGLPWNKEYVLKYIKH